MFEFRSFALLMLSIHPVNEASAAQADSSSDLEIIQVSGQRNDLRSNRLVANNTLFTEIETNQSSMATIADSLANVPGVRLTGQGGLLQSYSIRGFSRWRILTEVDGVPIITDRRAGNSASFIPSSLLSGFDVQKGPSSTLYGSDAIGGAINLKTIDFSERFITISGQSNDQTKEFTGAFGTQDWQTSVNYRHANNAESGDGEELNTHLEQLSLVNKARIQFDHLEGTLTWIPSIGKNIGKSAATYPSERITEYPRDEHSVLLAELTDHQTWYAKAYHHYQNWDSDVTRVNDRRNLTEYQGHTLGASLLSSHQVLAGEMRVGIDWINRQGVSIKEAEYNLNNQRQFSKQLIDGQQHNAALFSDIHWQLENLGVSAGLRYDHISQRQFIEKQQKSDNSLNGSVLVNYRPSLLISVQTELATGFRFPTLTELYFDGQTARGTTTGNPNLAPEKSKGIQVSATLSPSQNVELNIATYYYRMDNYIERYSVNENIVSYRNLDNADISGLESSVRWTPSEHWSHDLSFQWQQGEDQQNNALSDLQAPLWQMSTQWQNGDFVINNALAYRIKKHRFSAEEQKLASLLTWNLSLITSLSSATDLTIWGNNLLDRAAPTTADEDAPDIQGLNLGVKVSHRF